MSELEQVMAKYAGTHYVMPHRWSVFNELLASFGDKASEELERSSTLLFGNNAVYVILPKEEYRTIQ